MTIAVKVDPTNEQNVVLDFSGGQSMNKANTVNSIDETAMKSQLEQMEKENEAIRLSGRPARAIIKKSTFLGAYVNGNNPWVSLELEVLPEGLSAFSATAKGVISEAAQAKYQPGCEIYVKYDYYDNSKVAIDHS